MRKRVTSTSQRPIRVRFLDPATGKSISLTVYGGDLLVVARQAQYALGGRWNTTTLSDRRHQNRPF